MGAQLAMPAPTERTAYRQKRADEREKVEDGWKRLCWDISQGVLIVSMDLTSKQLFMFPSDVKKLQRVRSTAIRGSGDAVMQT